MRPPLRYSPTSPSESIKDPVKGKVVLKAKAMHRAKAKDKVAIQQEISTSDNIPIKKKTRVVVEKKNKPDLHKDKEESAIGYAGQED